MIDIDFIINQNNPQAIALKLAENFKKTRLSKNITQNELAERSGVPLSTLKRFEQKAEISLKQLLMAAVVLDSIESFSDLFTNQKHESMDDFLKEKESSSRKRARKKAN